MILDYENYDQLRSQVSRDFVKFLAFLYRQRYMAHLIAIDFVWSGTEAQEIKI